MLTCRIQIEFVERAITVAQDNARCRAVSAALTAHDSIVRRYRVFAERESRGRSPLYDMLTTRIAEDEAILSFLGALPEIKQQPNLLLGAVKYLFGAPRDWPHFKKLMTEHADKIRDCMLSHSTQTNEAARCATLLPVLANLPQPLALLEVGASAGLCLQPDRYAYDYGDGRVLRPRSHDDALVLPCAVNAHTPVPTRLPEIAWRAGLDLNPIDVSDHDQCAWLEALVWPEQRDRLARLRAAIAIARKDPPRLVRGNLLEDLTALAAQAPKHATLVIFHSAVLAYVWPQQLRDKFARDVRAMDAVWICNETPQVFPSIAAKTARAPTPGNFLLAVDGEPVAWTDHHGAFANWLPPST
jgi:hypothetical protein